jgi:hypothetical protein
MGVWNTIKKVGKGAIGLAVGGPVGAVVGSGALNSVGNKLWGGVKSTIGGQASFTPTAQNLDQTQANRDLASSERARANQNSLARALQQRVAGQAPSVAALQGQQGIAQAFQNASRIAANSRGVNRGLALRSGADAAATGMAAANRDATMLRAQEQVAAEQTLGQQLAQQRAQDLQQRTGSLQAAQSNQQAQLGAQQLQTDIASGNAARAQKGTGAALSFIGPIVGALASDIRVKSDVAPATGSFAERLASVKPDNPASIQGGYQAEQAAQSAGLARQMSRPAVDPSIEDSGASMPSMAANSKLADAFVQGLASAGGGLMSDARVKQDLAPINPYSYTYKPEMAASMAEALAAKAPPAERDAVRGAAYADARSPRVGVMTQELKRSKGGRKTVIDTPEGQAIEGRRALSFILANQAGLDKRMRALEGTAA